MNIVIVDDEPLMRETIKLLVAWEAYGYEVIADCYNGRNALEVIQTQNVDIVITDIKMPVMDGIALITETMKFKPEVKFLVLSAYEEFHIVSQAFRLGVNDYILKPEVSTEKLIEELEKLKAQINKKRIENQERLKIHNDLKHQQSEVDRLKNDIYLHRDLLKENILKDLISGHKNITEVIERCVSYGIDLDFKRLRILLIRIKDYRSIMAEEWLGDQHLLAYAFLNVIGEVVQSTRPDMKGEVCCNITGEFTVICSFPKINSEYEMQKALFAFFNRLETAIQECFNRKIIMGVSNCGTGYEELRDLYMQAALACEFAYVRGKSKILYYHGTNRKQCIDDIKFFTFSSKVRNLLTDFQNGIYETNLTMMEIEPETISLEDITKMKMIYEKYYYDILEFVHKKNIYYHVKELLNEYEQYIKECGDIYEQHEWTVKILRRIAINFEGNSQLVKAVKHYVYQHYSENISLSDVADSLDINASYLSRTFKKETGYGFTDYLIKIRIENAVELMQNGNIKIGQVSECVGFQNIEHFSRTFKTIMNKSPKEFLQG